MINLLVSIILFTVLALWLRHKRLLSVCPVCAGVVISWVLGLFLLYMEWWPIDNLFLGLMMGSSLGALAEKYGEHLGWFWKAVVVLSGLISIYYIVSDQLIAGTVFGLVIMIIALYKIKRSKPRQRSGDDMFTNCC